MIREFRDTQLLTHAQQTWAALSSTQVYGPFPSRNPGSPNSTDALSPRSTCSSMTRCTDGAKDGKLIVNGNPVTSLASATPLLFNGARLALSISSNPQCVLPSFVDIDHLMLIAAFRPIGCFHHYQPALPTRSSY